MKERISNRSLLVTAFLMLVLLNLNMQRAYAQVVYSETGDALTLESLPKGEDPENKMEIKISNIEKNDVITIESDNHEIVGFSYSDDEEDDYIENADRLEFGQGENKLKNGKWEDYFTILARRPGDCNVTVSVNGIQDRIYKVVVTKTKPGVTLEKKTMWNVDESNEFHFSGLSTDSEITVASNKTLYCAYGNTKPTKIDIGKSTQKPLRIIERYRMQIMARYL